MTTARFTLRHIPPNTITGQVQYQQPRLCFKVFSTVVMRKRTLAISVVALATAVIACGCRDSTLVSSSMTPSIKAGEKVTVDYTAYAVTAPKRWDVVAFEPPPFTNQIWLMRVVALPGETVSFATGGITVNGQSLSLPQHITNVTYVSLDHPALQPARRAIASPYVVPPNSFFVLGDNSINANDSRFWGAVSRTNIFGKVRNK